MRTSTHVVRILIPRSYRSLGSALGRWILGSLIGILSQNAHASEPIAFARVSPILQKNCFGCHGTDKPKGDRRIDQLDPDLIKGKDGDHWREVLDRLNFGDMPPETDPEENGIPTQILLAA